MSSEKVSGFPCLIFDLGNSMVFSAAELAAATRNYCSRVLIGRGGFGTVYRGTLRGSIDVAIKILSSVRG